MRHSPANSRSGVVVEVVARFFIKFQNKLRYVKIIKIWSNLYEKCVKLGKKQPKEKLRTTRQFWSRIKSSIKK